VIYAYGICEPAVAASTARRRGLGGATLRALEGKGLAAVYTRHRSLRPRPTPELVVEHERVVEAIMARGPVLPLRFGTQLEREDELSAVLAERGDELVRLLARVRGRTELGLRVIPEHSDAEHSDAEHSDAEHPDAGSLAIESSGSGYLLARVRAHRRAQQAIREIHVPLAELAVASRIREPPRAPAVLVAAYLVDSERVAEFQLRADTLARGQSAMQMMVTGPWPPYSFATEE
jgi:hypothetical protein